MTKTEKVHDASSNDPEKVSEIGRKTTFEAGELDDVVFKHANPQDADEALKAFAGLEGDSLEMTLEEEKKLLRKIDLNLMPVSPQRSIILSHHNIYLLRCCASYTDSITSTRLHSRMPVSWVFRLISIYMVAITNGLDRCSILDT